MSDAVQQIKERLSILDVVGQYVKLTKAGRSYRGLSPFNKEKTPSFFVSPERGFYHCFSSGKGGDMFTFVQEMEGIDFRGALKILAEKAGVELTPYERQERSEAEKLYAVLESASQFFERELGKRVDARTYLEGRGLTAASIGAWSLGYAPNEWQALTGYLRTEGYSDAEIEKAGLAKRPDREGASAPGRLYDRFRGRIMFPIRDVSGRIIAFSGRDFDGSVAQSGEKPAKYINSPETPVFIKSSALYGIHQAKEAMKKHGFAILVEGQMDLLMSHQAGFTNAVATSGTALSAGHLGIIKRYAPNAVIAYDGDSAGIAASSRASLLALVSGLNVKVAPFPAGMDPADLIVKEGKDAWKDAIRHAVHPVERALQNASTRKEQEAAYREALPFLASIESTTERAHHIRAVAEKLGLNERDVIEEVAKFPKETLRLESAAPAAATSGTALFGARRRDAIEERLYAAAAHQREAGKDQQAQKIEADLAALAGPERLEQLRGISEAHLKETLFELDIIEDARGSLDAEVGDLFRELAREHSREEYEKALGKLREAERSGAPPDEIEELMRTCDELKKQFI